MTRILFLKAIIPGGAASDLFAVVVPVSGYTTKEGTFVAPHQAERHKHIPAEPTHVGKHIAKEENTKQSDDTGRHQAAGIGKRPDMTLAIIPAKSGKGVYIALPPDAPEMRDAFKSAFPAADYFSDTKKWYLRGSTAEKRLRKWVETQTDALAGVAAREAEKLATANVARAESLKAKQALADADAALGPLANGEVNVSHYGSKLAVRFPFAASAVSAIKAVPGAQWDNTHKVWLVPQIERPALRAAVARINAALEPIMAAKAEEAARKESTQRELHARRWPMLLGDGLRVGHLLRLRGKIQAVESIGKPFYVNEDMPSVYGHLLGREGEAVAYAYLRDATEVEAASFEAGEMDKAARAAMRKAAIAEIYAAKDAFRAASVRPDGLVEPPSGEVVLDENRDSAIYGGGVRWVYGDGTLWQLRGNGGDGDDWSANNLPGAVATCVSGPLAKELADRLRIAAKAIGT